MQNPERWATKLVKADFAAFAMLFAASVMLFAASLLLVPAGPLRPGLAILASFIGIAGSLGYMALRLRRSGKEAAPDSEVVPEPSPAETIDRPPEGPPRDEKGRFLSIFRQAPLGMALVDEGGTVLECNSAFCALVIGKEVPPDDLRFLDYVGADDRQDLARHLRRAAGGTSEPLPLEIRLGERGETVVQVFAGGLGSSDGRRPCAILYLVETTEQKNLELQFAQSQKMQAVGQLAGGIAHDFNNLLTAIIGFSDLLLMRHKAGDPSFADIMQIKQNANRAANLVRQLLAFSRQQTLRTKVLVVTDVLAEISNLLRRLIGENIEFKMIHGRNLGPVKADQGQLEQVIINLAVNARDAMPDGGVLTIRTANVSTAESTAFGYALLPANDYVLIEVGDTGIGIRKEDAGNIFEPFFTTKEVGQGTGLGLSTVYGIVKQTDGFIFVESEPGAGAAFRIFLPVYSGQAVADSRVADSETPKVQDLTGKNTILLVEDEDAVRIFAARALRNKGYSVLEASGGTDALALVNSHPDDIDLLISDVVMPEMDGPTLVEQARKLRQSMKIIFISGYTEDAFRKKIDQESFSFLPKPFSLKQLAQTVKDVLQE